MKRFLTAWWFAVILLGGLPAHGAQVERGSEFYCSMVSTATSLTEITGCSVRPGFKYNITAIYWSSSIISTTTNYFLLQSGTGTNCATGTTSLFADFIPAAFGGGGGSFVVPLVASSGHALCFVHPGAGTRNISITGYVTP